MFDWEAAQHAVAGMAGPQALRLVAELVDGPKHYNALARATALDHKSLTRRLSRLEETGVVIREVQQHRPVRVHYRLTEEAQSLLPLLKGLGNWWRDKKSGGMR